MTVRKSNQVQSFRPAITSSQAGVVLCATGTIETSATPMAAGDLYELVKIPPEHEVIDGFVTMDQIDSGGSVVFQAGRINLLETDLDAGTLMMTGETTGQAGGIQRNDLKNLQDSNHYTTDRYWGVKITTTPTTQVTGTMSMTLFYRDANFNI